MKKSKGLHFVLVMFVIATMVFVPGPAKAAKVILKNIDFEPPTSFSVIHSRYLWVQMVNEQLRKAGYGDQYEIQYFPAEQLAKGADIYRAVRDGMAEIGYVAYAYVASLLPLYGVGDLPFIYKDHMQQFRLTQKLLANGLQAYLESKGVHMVCPLSTFGYGVWTRNKPIKVMEDMKGLKIRTAGGISSEIMKKLGAVPVSLTTTEIYPAMNAGTIDGMSFDEMVGTSLKLHETIKYAMRTPLHAVVGSSGIVMNLKAWNSLPKPVQSIFELCGETSMRHAGDAVIYSGYQRVTEIYKKSGITVSYLSPEEEQRWRKALMPIWDEWLAQHGNEFGGVGRKLWEIAKAHMENPNMEETGYESSPNRWIK
jgi:TRAP-type C4-dicarboxylate transport system substrate-binding protein